MVKERKENDTRQEKSDLDEERVVVKPMGVSKEDKDRKLENGVDAQKEFVELSAGLCPVVLHGICLIVNRAKGNWSTLFRLYTSLVRIPSSVPWNRSIISFVCV